MEIFISIWLQGLKDKSIKYSKVALGCPLSLYIKAVDLALDYFWQGWKTLLYVNPKTILEAYLRTFSNSCNLYVNTSGQRSIAAKALNRTKEY